MAGTLGATRFYACARHGARARHTRTHAAGRGRRLGSRSHRLRLLGFLPGRGSRAGAGGGHGIPSRGSAGSVACAPTGLGRAEGGSPRPGPESRSAAPRLSNPSRPVRAPACRAVHSSRGAYLVGVGIVAQLAASLGGAPRDTRSKTPLWLLSGSGPRGALFIYLLIPSLFSPAEPFCEPRLVPRAGPRATRVDPDSSPPPTRAPLKPFPISSHFPSPPLWVQMFHLFLKSAGSPSSPPPLSLVSWD